MVAEGEAAAVLREASRGLGEEQRLVLMLRYAEGLSVVEIGAVLGARSDRVRAVLDELREFARGTLGAAAATRAA